MVSFVTWCLTFAGLAIVSFSFWWLHFRKGNLISYPVHSFGAASITTSAGHLSVPLTLYNDGAIPKVVQNLRLRLVREPEAEVCWDWVSTPVSLNPSSQGGAIFPAAFAITPRSAEQYFIGFRGSLPPGEQDYRAHLEAKLGDGRTWRSLIDFDLQLGQAWTSGDYHVYRNVPNDLTPMEGK
jgi:hypothetical protein